MYTYIKIHVYTTSEAESTSDIITTIDGAVSWLSTGNLVAECTIGGACRTMVAIASLASFLSLVSRYWVFGFWNALFSLTNPLELVFPFGSEESR
jgi:hypothetical protein